MKTILKGVAVQRVIILSLLLLNGCTSVHYNTLHERKETPVIKTLSQELQSIGGNKQESQELASLCVTYAKVLANRYHLVWPPLYHNFLVNSGQREKGLCYDFVEGLAAEIKNRHFKSFAFKWGRANANMLSEHNVLVVLPKRGANFQEGIILDAWRNSGRLYFARVKDDPKYRFQQWQEGTRRLGF